MTIVAAGQHLSRARFLLRGGVANVIQTLATDAAAIDCRQPLVEHLRDIRRLEISPHNGVFQIAAIGNERINNRPTRRAGQTTGDEMKAKVGFAIVGVRLTPIDFTANGAKRSWSLPGEDQTEPGNFPNRLKVDQV